MKKNTKDQQKEKVVDGASFEKASQKHIDGIGYITTYNNIVYPHTKNKAKEQIIITKDRYSNQMLLNIVRTFEYSNGDTVGSIETEYQDNRIIRNTVKNLIYADGDKTDKVIVEFGLDGEKLYPILFYNYYRKQENKTYELLNAYYNDDTNSVHYLTKDNKHLAFIESMDKFIG